MYGDKVLSNLNILLNFLLHDTVHESENMLHSKYLAYA